MRGFFYLSVGLIFSSLLLCLEARAQGFLDNFNLSDPGVSLENWTVFRGDWRVSNGALVGEASNFDNNPLQEAWIWAGQPEFELPPSFGLAFEMDFLTDAGVRDVNGRHAGVMFCSTIPTHRWDSAGAIGGYQLDWSDRGGVRLQRIDGTTQRVLGTGGINLADPPRRWQILVSSNNIRVLGDNELLLEVEDNRYRGGHFGFWVWSNGTRVAYDNVMVSEISFLTLGGQGGARLQPGVAGNDSRVFCFRDHRDLGAPGNTVVFSLEGQEGDENILLMAWGRIPTPVDYDLVADEHSQSSQRMLVPFARDEDAYILLLAKKALETGNGLNSVIVRAALPGILLQELSVNSAVMAMQGGPPRRVTTSVFGAGFTQDTVFIFAAQMGLGITVVESRFVSSSHVLLTMELTGRNLPGLYRLQASNATGEVAQLPGAFRVVAGASPGVLDVNLIAAGKVRPFRPRPLQVRYNNIGGSSLAPCFLRISPPPGVQLKLANDISFSPPNTPVDILTVNPVGFPGALPPGASGVQNLIYVVNFVPDGEIEGAGQLEFNIEKLSAQAGDPLCLEPGLNCSAGSLSRPESVPPTAWEMLGNVLGTSLSDFMASLGGLSTRLALRGKNPASVSEALRLATHTAWTLEDPNHYSSAVSGVLRDSSGNPLTGTRVAAVRGTERACGETRPSGFFVIEGLKGGMPAYTLEVDGFNLEVDVAVASGGEVSLGSVVVGDANDVPFNCEIAQELAGVEPLVTSPDRLIVMADISVEIIVPIDPNYKSGTAGQSTVKEVDLGDVVPKEEAPPGTQANIWIPYSTGGEFVEEYDGRTIVYEITFENSESANGPAQKADVFDCLPPQFDWSTVRFLGAGVDYDYDCTSNTSIESIGGFTGEATCIPDSGGMNGNARFDIDLSLDDNVDVKIICEQDENLLSWKFISLQAGTQAEVVDDGQGFLQPHVPQTPEGEAWVQFSVDIKDEKDALAPGTLIRNDATVVFKDLEVPLPEPGQVVEPQQKEEWDGLDCEGDGGAAGFGGGQGAGGGPGYVLTTVPVYHVIPREDYFPGGCDNGEDDDRDGLEDCDDEDCDTSPACAPPRPSTVFLRGNANDDSFVDISDASRIFTYLFMGGEILSCRDAADANDDGSVDITDGIFLLSFLFQGGAVPPQPGPFECGEDPTTDAAGSELGCDLVAPACQ